MLVEHISVSRMRLWETCEQAYKDKYELKIASPEPTPVYFDYGKIIHKIIELHTVSGGEDINKIVKDMMTGKIQIDGKPCPQLPLEYKKKLPSHIKTYMKLAEKIGTNGLVEWSFKFDLDPPNERYVLRFID